MIDPRTAAFALGDPQAPPCLLLHGLTGSPSELRLLAEAIAAAGYRAVAPLHPGHGLGADDLLTADAAAWLAAARSALAALGQPTHLVGFSMGALLAVRLAAETPGEVRSLTLLAPAVRLASPASLLVWLTSHLPALPKRFPSLPSPRKSSLRDTTYVGRDLKNPRVSLRALAALRGLQLQALRDAARLRSLAGAPPSLVLLGALDKTIRNDLARALASALGARLAVMPRSSHQVSLDHDRALVAETVVGFLRAAEEIAPPRHAAS